MIAFAASPEYDPAVNKLSGFATVSYGEPAVERLSPPAVSSDAQRAKKAADVISWMGTPP